MSEPFTLNQEIREKFKAEIDYPSLLRHVPLKRQLVMDWRKYLATLKDAEGQLWQGDLDEPNITPDGIGVMNGRLKSSQGTILFSISALTGSWQQKLDRIMLFMSFTNRPDINFHRKDSAADLFLISKGRQPAGAVRFIFGDFYIKLNAWKNENVEPVAAALLQVMQDNSKEQDPTKVAKVFTLVTDNEISLNKPFQVHIKGLTADWPKHWIATQPENLMPATVEYVSNGNDVFSFRALQQGSISIPFTALNTTSLILSSEVLTITVK